MIERRPAALSLSIEIRDRTRVILQEAEQSQPFDETFDFSRAQLEDIHAPIRSDLDEFQRELGRPQQVSIAKVAQLLLKLQKRGRSVLYALFDNDTEKLQRVVSAFSRVCNLRNSIVRRSGGFDPPLITVRTTPGCGIPIEILPLATWRTEPNDERDLLKLASSFLGFSAIVKREGLGAPADTDSLKLIGDPCLPIRLFLTRDLGGPIADEQYFKKNRSIELDMTWPTTGRQPQGNICADLAKLLWHTNRGETQGKTPIQICHFACHCDTEDNYSDRYKIIFKSKMGLSTQVVTLEDLRDELMRLSEAYGSKGRRSLLIMNACGSAGLRPGSASSFPRLFLSKDMGFIGFVGTETTVSDGFASLFVQSLYNNLLSRRPIPLGLALHMVRWELLEKFNNPLGIIYSLYADPEIQVARNEIQLARSIRDAVQFS